MTTGAEILCDVLLHNGIDTCFANPGTSEMHFVAALDRRPDLRCILGLFEGVVTGAADGYARMADRPAATLLHTGPGLANGLANLHNARRARTAMVNVVGDHASYHLAFDAPLTSDIEALARPMSDFVRRAEGAGDVAQAATETIAAALQPPGSIATLILPADAAWNEAPASSLQPAPRPAPAAPDPDRVANAARALREDGETVLILSGAALRADATRRANDIASATGAGIIAQQSNARIERGRGRIALERVPYSVDLAVGRFARTRRVILVGAKAPVAFFAHPGKPSSCLPEDCEVLTLAEPGDDIAAALDALAGTLGARATDRMPAPALPEMPTGRLTPATIAAVIARHLPENAIVCDESVSSGRDFFGYTHGAAPHDHLQLTGGAIGEGLPLAVGAATACPDRKVIALQADGSAMYTNQALWTMAREDQDVVVVILANHRYAILQGELRAVGADEPGRNARRMLDLVEPTIDWVSLARGMGVEAARTDSAEGFSYLFSAACRRRGPFLIQADLP